MVILKVLTPFIFPENEMPAPVKTTFAPLSASAMGVPMNEFLKLTRIPIVIYYGDFIAEKPDTAVGPDKWRSEYEMAKQFVMTVNRHGEDIEGKAPIAPIPVGDELRRVGTANQTKISGAPVQGPLFDFAPTINQFLQTHLFGDIFARDNLDWQSRELATVGALAATPGVEAQLLSHTRASLRVGLTAAQLRQLAQVLREHGDNDAATRADEALQKALENK